MVMKMKRVKTLSWDDVPLQLPHGGDKYDQNDKNLIVLLGPK